MEETWIDIKNIEGYEVSNRGRVRNAKTKRMLKPYLNRPGGYERVDIRGKHLYIHRLMAENFCYDGLEPGDIVKHRDKNKRRNHIHNLKIIRK